ncbi:DUF2834 domain-containing protein [bacterium]|nr:DUF2834 domain-containing protein [bacterium]
MTTRTRQYIYQALAVLGLAATWYFNIRFSKQYGGFAFTNFLTDSCATNAACSIASDVSVAALAFLFWSYHESKRIAMRFWWIYAVLTFMVALAFAFPLYLFMRERHMTANAQQA